jgi:large subunit ribosomal protein L25
VEVDRLERCTDMTKIKLEVEERKSIGKKGTKSIRYENKVPAVVYGKGIETASIQIDAGTLDKALHSGQGRNNIFTLKVEGKDQDVIPYHIQFHAITKRILHVDFKTVTKDEKVRIRLKVEIKGTSVGIKQGGSLEKKIEYIWVKILPFDIPDSIVLDITPLKIGESVFVKDLNLPAGTDVINFTPDQKVVFIKGAVAEEEEEDAPLAPATPEATDAPADA